MLLNSNGGSNRRANTTPRTCGKPSLSPAGYPSDVISFVSDPLAEDTTLAGNLVANLFVSTDVEDTAFTYTISEVDADGTAHNIRNGLLTWPTQRPLCTGRLRLCPRPGGGDGDRVPAHRLDRLLRNRIRIDISSSDFPSSATTQYRGQLGRTDRDQDRQPDHLIGGEYPQLGHAAHLSLGA